MIKKLTLITILLLGNIAFSQEPKLIEKYLFATLKGKIDDRYDITMNIKISKVSYSWTGETSGYVSGNYYYDRYGKYIYFIGYIDNNSITIEADKGGVFKFKLDKATLNNILELKTSSKNITINGTLEGNSKSFPCVINSLSPLGGKLSEMFEYSVSDNDDDYKSILYSPSINVSYFDNDIKNIDIKNLKSIYDKKLKKVINNETYNYSNCSSEITYFDDKILCVKDWLTYSSIEDLFNYSENRDLEDLLYNSSKPADFYDCNIISLESGKKINNTLEDLVDYDEKFIEFLTKEYKEYKTEIKGLMDLFRNSYNDEPSDDFYFPDDLDLQNDSDLTEQSDNLSEQSFDLPEDINKSKFIFNNDGTIDIDIYPFPPIEMKKLKPYIKKDSFYRYLFNWNIMNNKIFY